MARNVARRQPCRPGSGGTVRESFFRSDAEKTERAVVSGKGGRVGVPMVRDLKGVLDREKAPIGVFLTLEPPARPMEFDACIV